MSARESFARHSVEAVLLHAHGMNSHNNGRQQFSAASSARFFVTHLRGTGLWIFFHDLPSKAAIDQGVVGVL